jgi:hypothetical protein
MITRQPGTSGFEITSIQLLEGHVIDSTLGLSMDLTIAIIVRHTKRQNLIENDLTAFEVPSL